MISFLINDERLSLKQEDEFGEVVVEVNGVKVGVFYFEEDTGRICFDVAGNQAGDYPVNIEFGESLQVFMSPVMVKKYQTLWKEERE